MKPLYGPSTAREDWHGTIRGCEELGRGFTSVGKSVFFWTQQGFDYGYGGKFRDAYQTILEKGILRENANFETGDGGKFLESHIYTSMRY